MYRQARRPIVDINYCSPGHWSSKITSGDSLNPDFAAHCQIYGTQAKKNG